MHRGKRSTQDAEQKPQIRTLLKARAGNGNGRCPAKLALHPVSPLLALGVAAAAALRPVRIRALHQRRQRLDAGPEAPRSRNVDIRRRSVAGTPAPEKTRARRRRAPAPRPPRRQPSNYLLFQSRKKSLLSLHSFKNAPNPHFQATAEAEMMALTLSPSTAMLQRSKNGENLQRQRAWKGVARYTDCSAAVSLKKETKGSREQWRGKGHAVLEECRHFFGFLLGI